MHSVNSTFHTLPVGVLVLAPVFAPQIVSPVKYSVSEVSHLVQLTLEASEQITGNE